MSWRTGCLLEDSFVSWKTGFFILPVENSFSFTDKSEGEELRRGLLP